MIPTQYVWLWYIERTYWSILEKEHRDVGDRLRHVMAMYDFYVVRFANMSYLGPGNIPPIPVCPSLRTYEKKPEKQDMQNDCLADPGASCVRMPFYALRPESRYFERNRRWSQRFKLKRFKLSPRIHDSNFQMGKLAGLAQAWHVGMLVVKVFLELYQGPQEPTDLRWRQARHFNFIQFELILSNMLGFWTKVQTRFLRR